MDFSTDNIVTLITSIIGAFIGYVTCRLTLNKPQRFKLLENQLYKVYLPLFEKIEPNLFKTITLETAKEYIDFFNNIKSNNYELIDSELCNLFWIFENSYNSNELDIKIYSAICSRLDILFESTRRKLYMPTRTIFYKVNRRQFPKRIIDSGRYICNYLLKTCTIVAISYIFMISIECIFNIVSFIFHIIFH